MTEPREMDRDARRDDPARFLRELRQLRSHAGLDHGELASRAHYPCEAIRAAEAGPSLPDLPVLSAYVRGCGGTSAEWEERWRSVTGSPASPLLTTRGSGWSEAADAGARVGAAAASALAAAAFAAADDGHDPERVMAALNRVADGMAAVATASAASAASADAPVPDAPADAPVWEPMPKAPAPDDVPRPTVPAGAAQVPVGQAGRPRRPVSARKALVLLAVVAIAVTALAVVAAVLVFSR